MATSGMDQNRLKNALDAFLGTATLTAFVTPPLLRLMTANGSETTNGTELGTSGGYTAGSGVTFGASAFAASTFSAGAAGSSNSNAVTITNMPAATIVAAEIWDSAGTKLRWWFGLLTASKTTNAGDTLTFAVGSVTPSFAG
jgi:hypothetical protein